MDQSYCSGVKGLLEHADDWVINMEQLYAQSEVHAISNIKGDTKHVGMLLIILARPSMNFVKNFIWLSFVGAQVDKELINYWIISPRRLNLILQIFPRIIIGSRLNLSVSLGG